MGQKHERGRKKGLVIMMSENCQTDFGLMRARMRTRDGHLPMLRWTGSKILRDPALKNQVPRTNS